MWLSSGGLSAAGVERMDSSHSSLVPLSPLSYDPLREPIGFVNDSGTSSWASLGKPRT